MKEYSWSIEYTEALPMDVAIKYHKCASILKAKDRLYDVSVISYPTMKKDGRSKLYTQLKKEADPPELRPALSAGELGRQLGKVYGGN